MSEFFGALATFFGKLGTFSAYLTDRLSATYDGFSSSQRIVLFIFMMMAILFVAYVITLILRFSFKISTRKLKNVRREYQITLNRAKGKRCNFMWDILLYQKIVILDDPLMQKEEDQQVLLTA